MERKRVKKVGIILVAIAVVIAITICFFTYFTGNLQRTIALKSEHFEVNNAMLSYFIHAECEKYVAQYENYAGTDYLSTVGLDPSVSLKKQKCCYEQDTWFEYFADEALARLHYVLPYCEAATKQGLIDEKAVSSRVEEKMIALKSLAEEQGRNMDSYIEHIYGRNVRVDDVKQSMRLETIADLYTVTIRNGKTFTDKELDEYAKANSKDFLYVDYQSYSSIPSFKEGNDTVSVDKAMAAAKKEMESLAIQVAEKGFDSAVAAHIAASSEKDTTQNLSVKTYAYNTDTQLGSWLFNEQTKDGDTTIIQGNGMYTLYYRVGNIYRQEYPSVKLQIVQVKLDEFDDTSQMQKTLKGLKEGLNKYNGTEDSLHNIAKSVGLSVEENDATLKGEYGSNVIDNWMFDSTRKVGDCQMFELEESVFVMRHGGNGEVCWKALARRRLTEQKQVEDESNLLKLYPVKEGKILESRISG